MKAEGVRRGVADIIFLAPQPHGPLLIEMKKPQGYQSPEQKAWQRSAEAAGYKYVVCRSLDEFITEINNHLHEENQ